MTSTVYHRPVLLTETVDGLVSDPAGLYIDGTLGGGGHSTALLERLAAEATLFGIDQDPEAHEAAAHLKSDSRFHALRGNFGHMESLIPAKHHGRITGILLDLGVSSHQIDADYRGFSFQAAGPLDMRMDRTRALTAAVVLNEYEPARLRDIFYRYGEERWSPKIVQAVVDRRPLATTDDLKAAVLSVVKGPMALKSVARIFQAVRIEVNGELEVLEQALVAGLKLLAPGGRFAVLAYHSLEDRMVKHFFRSGRLDGVLEKDFYGNDLGPFEPVTKGAVEADAAETAQNPRARSARLRIVAKKREAA